MTARITKSLLPILKGGFPHHEHRSKRGRRGNIKKISHIRIYKHKKEELKYEKENPS